jgi:hypothetical protein
MEPTEECILCGEAGDPSDLGIWISEHGRWPVHAACFVSAYQTGDLEIRVRRRSA